MDNPCGLCAEYPFWCSGICKDKAKYLAEVDEDTQIVRKMEFTKKKKGKLEADVDVNKNGIRRERTNERHTFTRNRRTFPAR